jgi:hypothetical protein
VLIVKLVQPSNELFSTQRDAAMHLAGLSAFWGGFAATCLAAALDAPSAVTLAAAMLTIGGIVVSMSATRRLEKRITARRVRPWPLGYPGCF